MNIFFSSDFHINHKNIIKYCNRPFSDVETMNSTIINRCNERVKEDDLLFFLGDFIFKSGSGRGEGEPYKAIDYKKLINCKNIVWCGGNHDRNNTLKTPIKKIIINHGGRDICLVHNPLHIDWNYNFHITGHVHEKWMFKSFEKNGRVVHCCNVSVEQWNYYPVTWEKINKEYQKWLRSNKNV